MNFLCVASSLLVGLPGGPWWSDQLRQSALLAIIYFPFPIGGASLVAQTVKNLPAMQDFQPLDWEDSLEKKRMATYSSILACPWWRPWTEEPGGLQSMGSQRVGQDWATNTFTFPRRGLYTTPLTTALWTVCRSFKQWLRRIVDHHQLSGSFPLLWESHTSWSFSLDPSRTRSHGADQQMTSSLERATYCSRAAASSQPSVVWVKINVTVSRWASGAICNCCRTDQCSKTWLALKGYCGEKQCFPIFWGKEKVAFREFLNIKFNCL